MSDGRIVIFDANGNQVYLGENNPMPAKVMGSKYQDLGLIIDAGAVAAGATISETNWHDNFPWVRNIVALLQSDQNGAFGLIRRDSFLSQDGGTQLGTFTANGSSWTSVIVSGISATFGYSGRFYYKNTSASASTTARLRIQLLGQ